MEIITKNRLANVHKIYSHASCNDGIISAMICASSYYQALYTIPDIEFIQYDTDKHQSITPSPGVMFIDMTPSQNNWKNWREFYPIILDHHETTKYIVEGLHGIYGNSIESGSTLSFYHVMKRLIKDNETTEQWQKLAELATIRDTWQTNHEQWQLSQELNQGMQLFSCTELIELASQNMVPFNDFYKFGKKLYNKMIRKAEVLVSGAYIETILIKGKEIKIGFFNCTEKITSETCHILLERGCDVAVSYFILNQDDKNQIVVSIRSKSKDFPINKIAQLYGGGGHLNAAGFRITTKLYLESVDLVISHIHDGLHKIFYY